MPTTAFAADGSTPAGITGTGTDIIGSGASDDPYLIYTAAGLKAFRDAVNGQNELTRQPGAHAKLMNDITLNDGTFDADGSWNKSGTPDEWEPIGWYTNPGNHASYSGTFDGQGFTIHGLYVTGKRLHAGLFGHAQNATIKT